MQNGLRELRKRHQMTLKEVGDVLGITPAAVSHIELGRNHLYDEHLLKLSEFFSVPIEQILRPTQLNEDDPAYLVEQKARLYANSAISNLDEEERLLFQQLLSSFLNLSLKGKAELVDTADTMVRSGKYAELGETSFSGRNTGVQAAGAA